MSQRQCEYRDCKNLTTLKQKFGEGGSELSVCREHRIAVFRIASYYCIKISEATISYTIAFLEAVHKGKEKP